MSNCIHLNALHVTDHLIALIIMQYYNSTMCNCLEYPKILDSIEKWEKTKHTTSLQEDFFKFQKMAIFIIRLLFLLQN